MFQVTQLITLPFSGAANYLFEAQFNALGVMPAVYASLLMPGRCPCVSHEQQLG